MKSYKAARKALQRGVKEYYFMEGGTNAFYKGLREEFAKED